ncbi:MAG: hypothetical protein Q8P02_04805 [Candidatus Micrarchaeota archaeon]|nr:hypothetical protein [Candidatus Micrarchaeota archaeon]
MVNMTLSVPDALREKMKKYPLKWSEVARKAFEKEVMRLETLDRMDEVLKDSTMTEEDAERIGDKIKAEIRKRFK